MAANDERLPLSERAQEIVSAPFRGEIARIAALVGAAGVEPGVAAMLASAIASGQRHLSDPSYAAAWLVEWMSAGPASGTFLPRTLSEAPTEPIGVVGNVFALQRAQRYARRTQQARYVGTRHLLAAIIDEIDVEAHRRLIDAGLDLLAFRPHFLRKLKTDESSVDDRAAWEAIFAEQDRRLPRPTYLPGFSADRTDVEDALGVSEEAAIFARLICYENATPPLSIGLFGEWGSGKSFFMERIETEVDSLVDRRLRLRMEASAAGATAGPLRPDAFVTDVMQLRFNAWHYADGDTFASLTAEIFDQLRLGGHKGRDGAARKRLYDLVTRDIDDTEKRRDAGRKAAADEEEKAKDAAETIQGLERARLTLELKTVAELADETIAELVAKPADEKKPNETRKAVDAAGRKLGIADLSDQTEELRAELAGVSTTGGKLFLVFRGLSAASSWGTAVFILVAVLAALVGAFTVHTADWVRFLAALAAAASPMVAALAALLRAYRVVKPIIDLSARYAERLKEKQDANAKAIAEKTAELEAARTREAEARAAVAAAEARLTSLPGSATADGKATLLRYFLFETEETRGFEKTLGVIHRARRAFETLDAIIVEYRSYRALNRRREARDALSATEAKALEEGDARFRTVLDEERVTRDIWWKAHAGDLTARPPRGTIPDRVVLYIDDLDRCRTDQVVKVLEAVHLLLAFRSFVVVVGVDARWIRAALTRYYEAQIAAGDAAPSSAVATPDDYLEKIFQIPYWLRPISLSQEEGTLAGLLRGIAGAPLPEEVATAKTIDRGRLAAAAGIGTDSAIEPPSGSIDLVPYDPVEERELAFYAREHRVFEALGPLIARSPRSVKRFVNSYRLIRDRHRDRLDEFAGEAPDAPFVIVAFLLAIEVGLSHNQRDECLADIGEHSAFDVLAEISSWFDPPNPGEDHVDLARRTSRQGRLINSASKLLDLGHQFSTRQLAEWQPTVSRLSFHGPNRGD